MLRSDRITNGEKLIVMDTPSGYRAMLAAKAGIEKILKDNFFYLTDQPLADKDKGERS